MNKNEIDKLINKIFKINYCYDFNVLFNNNITKFDEEKLKFYIEKENIKLIVDKVIITGYNRQSKLVEFSQFIDLIIGDKTYHLVWLFYQNESLDGLAIYSVDNPVLLETHD